MRVLYVSDHKIDAYLIKALREVGHVVELTDQPPDGLAMASGGVYEAVLLDWVGSPEACAARFAAGSMGSLIFVITAYSDDSAMTRIPQAGADACFSRPAPFIELQARLEALIRLVRRARPAAGPSVELIAAEQAVRLNDLSITLSTREFRVMEHLVAHAGEVIDVDRLLQQVWGEADEPRPDLVRAGISRLRRKLEAAGAAGWLRVVSGHGYLFQQPSPAAEAK
jgi:two-component system, OmpR family, response regulator